MAVIIPGISKDKFYFAAYPHLSAPLRESVELVRLFVFKADILDTKTGEEQRNLSHL